jgi:type III restriction enzyme
LIWRYLVEEKGVKPETVAVYASLEVDKNHKPPVDFNLFRGGDKDYDNFVHGDYRHIIFNLGLQEGWDDPSCYFAYIDKSMQSNVQVEQVIGRVLRQPGAQHYESEQLNTAHFYVRVDQRGVFGEIVKTVREKLSGENPEIEFSAYESRSKKPIAYEAKKRLNVPHVYRDPSRAKDPIDEIIGRLIDFRHDHGDNIRGQGAHALVQQKVGEAGDEELIWVERDHSNRVSARWVFQRAVRREFPLALEVTRFGRRHKYRIVHSTWVAESSSCGPYGVDTGATWAC